MDKNTNQNNLVKILLVLFLVGWGILSAANELFVSKNTAILPSEPQVLAASTFRSVEDTFPRPQPTSTISTASARPVDASDFAVSVPVLMYHRIRDVLLVTERSDIEFSVPPESLEQQLSYLHDKGYQTISLSDLSESFENRTPLPSKSVLLTFDDGFRDFYLNAFPLLKKYNMRAVAFYVGGYSNFPGYMDQQMLREIHNSGLVDIQAHTMSHSLLTKLKLEEQRREIFESKQVLETILGKKINYFAYPYGNFDQNVINLTAEAGYRLGFGTTPGMILRKSEKLSLPRISITGFDDLKRFEQKLGVKIDEEKQPILPDSQEKETTTSSAAKNP